MFHGVAFAGVQGQLEDEGFVRQRLDAVLNLQSRMGSIIERHTNLKQEAIAELFREAQIKDPAYARQCEIIDQIRPVEIPGGSPIVQLIFSR